MILRKFIETINWIKKDYHSHPIRLLGESYGCAVTILTATIFAFTVPIPPMHLLYPLWITAVFILMLCAKSRGSFGLVLLNLSMLILDIFGYVRLLLVMN